MSWMTPPVGSSGCDMVAPPAGGAAKDLVDVVTLLLHADQPQPQVGGQIPNQVEAVLAVDLQFQQVAGRADPSAGRGQGVTQPVSGAALRRLAYLDDQHPGRPGEVRGCR